MAVRVAIAACQFCQLRRPALHDKSEANYTAYLMSKRWEVILDADL